MLNLLYASDLLCVTVKLPVITKMDTHEQIMLRILH